MPIKLAQFLDKPVFAAIPALFGDERAREYILVEIEPAGLWLSGAELTDRFGRMHEAVPQESTTVTLFVPFAHILYLFGSEQFAGLARPGTSLPGQTKQPDRPSAEEPERPRRKTARPRR